MRTVMKAADKGEAPKPNQDGHLLRMTQSGIGDDHRSEMSLRQANLVHLQEN